MSATAHQGAAAADRTAEQAERDIAACQRLTVEFARAIDERLPERLRQIFTDDCVFERRGERVHGIDALIASQSARAADIHTLHLCVNACVDLVGADQAGGTSYFTLYRHVGALPGPLGPPEVIGRYRDLYRRTPDGWRIAERTAQALLRAATR